MHGLKISNEEYRSRAGLSSTDIKRMAQSMAHYKYYYDHPESKDTPALQFGRAYHKYCLEPSDFYNEFVVAPNIDRRTKAGKEEWAEFVAESDGLEIITQDTLQVLDDMRNALYATPYVKKLIYGFHEESFFWNDEATDLYCKCRPDSYGSVGKQPIIVDLKTCQSADTQKFMRDAVRLNYDIQAAHYCNGMKAVTGDDYIFVFVAQEKTPPYLCNVLQADEYFMQSGADTRLALLEMYKECLAKDDWCGYMGFRDEVQISSLGLPDWMKKSYGYVESEVDE